MSNVDKLVEILKKTNTAQIGVELMGDRVAKVLAAAILSHVIVCEECMGFGMGEEKEIGGELVYEKCPVCKGHGIQVVDK